MAVHDWLVPTPGCGGVSSVLLPDELCIGRANPAAYDNSAREDDDARSDRHGTRRVGFLRVTTDHAYKVVLHGGYGPYTLASYSDDRRNPDCVTRAA